MAAVIAWKYVVWFAELPRADKKRVLFGIPTPRTLGAVGGGDRRMPAPSPYLPRQSAAGIHAHVAGLRLVPAHRGGVDRNGGLPRPALGAVAGTCLLQVLRADADAAREALLRFRDGLAAALRPVGRGAGMGQTFLLAGDGNAPHDPDTCRATGSPSRHCGSSFRRGSRPKASPAASTAWEAS